jgi:ElaB/YqjD/DUF883 family membrane-anchored ribosome-binding protein
VSEEQLRRDQRSFVEIERVEPQARQRCPKPNSRPMETIMSSSNTRYGSGRNDGDNEADTVEARARKSAQTLEKDASEMADSAMKRAGEMAETVNTKLKTVGVDTEAMANAAKDQASELQRLVTEEMRSHPVRALGIAAAVGVFVGLMTAR